MKRAHICDVPHCGRSRLSRQRLCDTCFRKLPPWIRVGIKAAKRERRQKDWRTLRDRAAEFLNMKPRDPAAQPPRITAERAYELNQRLLGERPDA